MIRTLFIVFFLLQLMIPLKVSPKYFTTRTQQHDTILWSTNKKLVWDDFKGSVPNEARYYVLAKTSSGIRRKARLQHGRLPVFKVESYFIKSNSWSRVTDTVTLAHEQLHFDISELYARKIRKAFDSLMGKNVSEIRIYDSIYKKQIERFYKENNDYDDQVYYDSVKQKQWITDIGRKITELEAFRNPMVGN